MTNIMAMTLLRPRPDAGSPNTRLPFTNPPNINRTSMPFVSSRRPRLFNACAGENHPHEARFSGVYLAFHHENHRL
ncbi:hypothetical protein P2D89_23725 [Agrobacterium rhizogenes]|uniref:hypothetical protein n=1 Tax=Rhizobium rhizogenes TaxID=359 RepID=UPI002863477C|nr:hypothetical protein [Rhizobium rhizogenes]MDF1892014.1 hypothetical protein [Rhizobium rhizogenes]